MHARGKPPSCRVRGPPAYLGYLGPGHIRVQPRTHPAPEGAWLLVFPLLQLLGRRRFLLHLMRLLLLLLLLLPYSLHLCL
jgi:hypothetical protein